MSLDKTHLDLWYVNMNIILGLLYSIIFHMMMQKWLGKYTMENKVTWILGEKMQTSAETTALFPEEIYQINACDGKIMFKHSIQS